MFLDAGRAQIRDLLEAQDALLSAQNALTASVVSYRVAELAIQRDTGVLEVDEKGLWQEYSPGGNQNVQEEIVYN
jgi:outer membrane protein TolC